MTSNRPCSVIHLAHFVYLIHLIQRVPPGPARGDRFRYTGAHTHTLGRTRLSWIGGSHREIRSLSQPPKGVRPVRSICEYTQIHSNPPRCNLDNSGFSALAIVLFHPIRSSLLIAGLGPFRFVLYSVLHTVSLLLHLFHFPT